MMEVKTTLKEEVEIFRLIEKDYEEAVDVLLTSFVPYENLCIATNIMDNPNAVKEIEVLIRYILIDGVSFGVRCGGSNRLAAVCLNKILEPESNCNFDAVFAKYETPEMTFITDFLDYMETKRNIYDIYTDLDVSCCLEIVFISTRPEFCKKGLAKMLTQHTIEFTKNLGNVAISFEHINNKRPKAICAVLTSTITQSIMRGLGFKTVNQANYCDFSFKGRKISEKLDPRQTCSTFVVMKL